MKKLFIDYNVCSRCKDCNVKCSYHFHPENNGIISLRELVSFWVACRRCDDYPCVNSCPSNALKRETGIIKRSNFLCVSCKSCSLACPFGTIDIDWLVYLTSRCDVCTGSRLDEEERFICIKSCPYNALKIVEEEEIKGQKYIHKIGENILVKAVSWIELYEVKK